MTETVLQDCRILIVEDEYFLAEDLRYELSRAGAIVAGTASTLKEAFEIIEAEEKLDCAILDVNLGGKPVFPVADRLSERGVPFVFTTGYDASVFPASYKEALRCEKPFNIATVLQSIRKAIERNHKPQK